MSKETPEEIRWLILWCEKDYSYSLIHASEVVCDEDVLAVGDTVKFFYDSEEWDGEVRVIGGENIFFIFLYTLIVPVTNSKTNHANFLHACPNLLLNISNFVTWYYDLSLNFIFVF